MSSVDSVVRHRIGPKPWVMLAFLFGILVLMVLNGFIPWLCFKKNYSTAGQYGDSFAISNTLFTGLTLAGIIYTLFLQMQEIEAARIDRLEQARLMSAAAQIDACTTSIHLAQKEMDDEGPDTPKGGLAKRRLQLDTLRLEILVYKFRPELDFDWRPFLSHIVGFELSRVEQMHQVMYVLPQQLKSMTIGHKVKEGRDKVASLISDGTLISNIIIRLDGFRELLPPDSDDHRTLRESITQTLQPVRERHNVWLNERKAHDEESLLLCIDGLRKLAAALTKDRDILASGNNGRESPRPSSPGS